MFQATKNINNNIKYPNERKKCLCTFQGCCVWRMYTKSCKRKTVFALQTNSFRMAKPRVSSENEPTITMCINTIYIQNRFTCLHRTHFMLERIKGEVGQLFVIWHCKYVCLLYFVRWQLASYHFKWIQTMHTLTFELCKRVHFGGYLISPYRSAVQIKFKKMSKSISHTNSVCLSLAFLINRLPSSRMFCLLLHVHVCVLI